MTRSKLKRLEKEIMAKTGKGMDFPNCVFLNESGEFMDFYGQTYSKDEITRDPLSGRLCVKAVT